MTASSYDGLNLPDAKDISIKDILPAIMQIAGLQTALAARLIAELKQPEPAMDDDVLLTAEEACVILKMKKTWLYSHAGNLPFTRHTGSRAVRFSKNGLFSWLARRR